MTQLVLLTGISGFVAKHIALRLLNAGYVVRGTLRSLDRANEVRAAIRPYLKSPDAEALLTFAAADLEQDAGWSAAMQGASALVHSASPFPISQPKDEAVLIRPAVEGTARVLRAAKAAGIARVVLTSSTVAVCSDGKHGIQTEDDWCDTTLPTTTPYAKSKTLAERRAWDIARSDGLALTTINPGFILGPPMDLHYGSSIRLVARILKGKDPLMPPFGFPVVDVRDVAEMHLRAVQRPETAGRRFIASAGSLSMAEMGRVLKAEYPVRRIPTREAPQMVMRLLSVVDAEIRSILPKLGHVERVSNNRAVHDMGIEFIGPQAALKASADWLVKHGQIWV